MKNCGRPSAARNFATATKDIKIGVTSQFTSSHTSLIKCVFVRLTTLEFLFRNDRVRH